MIRCCVWGVFRLWSRKGEFRRRWVDFLIEEMGLRVRKIEVVGDYEVEYVEERVDREGILEIL